MSRVWEVSRGGGGLGEGNDDLHTPPTLTGVVVPPELELPTSQEKKEEEVRFD